MIDSKTELNSLKAEINNSVRTYQDFCNRNLEMNKRINELQLIVDELEARRTKLKKTTTESNHHIAEFQESNAENDNLNLEMEQEVVRLISDLSRPPSNIAINYHSDENDTLRS